MSVIGPTIEVATIDERHGQPGLLKEFGTKIIFRLSFDPVPLPPEVLKRAVVVDRISPRTGEVRWQEVREIGWAGLTDHLDRCRRISGILNEQRITEDAAIGVMLLLIPELEGAVLTDVVQIGAGGDYLVRYSDYPEPVQVEVSGIKVGTVGKASTRLGKKRAQVRGAGFVSVTTFQHGRTGAAHSYLHFVEPGSGAKSAEGKGPKGKKK
jgi:hypothetical protein